MKARLLLGIFLFFCTLFFTLALSTTPLYAACSNTDSCSAVSGQDPTSTCCSGDFCSGSGFETPGKCIPRITSGGQCDNISYSLQGECQANLICDGVGFNTEGKCAPAGAIGDSCSRGSGTSPLDSTQGTCQTGLLCDGAVYLGPGKCVSGTSPNNAPTPTPTAVPINPCPSQKGICTTIDTALGTIDVSNTGGFIKVIFGTLLSLAGGIAVLLIIFSGYRIMTAQGDPEKVKGAREMLTSAIIGLLFMIFSVTILQILGVDILQLPGFGK